MALASVLAAKPRLLLLDEPTRGLDCVWKEELGRLLREMAIEGMAVVVVTHDTEFVAQYAERVILLFDGHLVADGPKHAVLGRSVFYAPQICRLFHGFTEEIVLTLEEACALVRSGGEMPGRAPA
ncbi:MAG TPA: hypothetical protein DCL13_03815 [Peptococcaceae bacterium]|nr:hypothetical protein [Peptococcaceae bacterium]